MTLPTIRFSLKEDDKEFFVHVQTLDEREAESKALMDYGVKDQFHLKDDAVEIAKVIDAVTPKDELPEVVRAAIINIAAEVRAKRFSLEGALRYVAVCALEASKKEAK